MKKRRRCNLCGAKLDGNICRECGYNNAAYDYHVNQSQDSCRHSSTEHYYSAEEHEAHTSPENIPFDYSENWQEDSGRWENFSKQYSGVDASEDTGSPASGTDTGKKQTVYGLNESRKEAKRKKKKPVLLWVLIIAWIVVSFLWEVREGIHSVVESYFDSKAEPENVLEKPAVEGRVTEAAAVAQAEPRKVADGRMETEEAAAGDAALVPVEGGFAEILDPGLYVAGVHFPAGICDVEWNSGGGGVYCWKRDSYYYDSSYLYDTGDGEKQRMEGLELKAGTMVMISGTLQASFSVREPEGYLKELPKEQKGEAVSVTDAVIIGGELGAGTYQVTWISGDLDQSEVIYTYTSQSDMKRSGFIEFDEECKQYANLILRDGDVLAPLNCRIKLEPAEYDLSDYADQLF